MLSLVSKSMPRLRVSSSRSVGSLAGAKSCSVCSRPSSITTKSSAWRSLTRFPSSSRTVTVTLTSSSPTSNTGASWAAESVSGERG